MGCSNPPFPLPPSLVFSRDGSLRPSSFADVRCIDAVIAIEGPQAGGSNTPPPNLDRYVPHRVT